MTTIFEYIRQLELIPLRGDQLTRMLSHVNYKGATKHARWILYDDLYKIRDLDQIFNKKTDALFILLRIRSEANLPVGHWICITRTEYSYHVFDPYGLDVEEELHVTHEPGYIRRLLAHKRHSVNKFRFQKVKTDINTCGIHCCMRALMSHLSNDEFAHFMNTNIHHIDYDKLVTLIFRFTII